MKKSTPRINAKGKFAFILVAFLACLCVLLTRITYFKVAHGEEFEMAAKNQQINRYDLVISANRGSVLDRNNQVLAISTAVYNVVLDSLVLAEATTEQQDKTIATLCEYFPELDYATLKNYITINPETGQINLPNHWRYLVKGISRELKEELEGLSLKGLYYEQTSKRSYPLKSTASHLIGFIRGDAQWGIEGYYNDYMLGTPGRSFILYESSGGVTHQQYPAQNGNTVITTIDSMIQQFAEEVVADTIKQWPSENVSALVMDPNTGEVLALAESNSFDLNAPSTPLAVETDENFRLEWEQMTDEEQMEYLNKMWKLFSVSSTYEPGSIYKPMVVAAALQEGLITENTTFYCSGSMDVAGHKISCHLTSGHGSLNAEDILAQSCNMGVIQIAQLLGAENMNKYQLEFGFGQKTGIDVSGEASGILHSLSAIGASELATMSFGQTFTSTSIQVLSAFSSLINGGYLVQPHVVSQIVDESGNVVLENNTNVMRRVVSEDVSSYMRTALKATVERGTGRKIQIEGYSLGCKTGTAEQGSRARDDLWTLTHVTYFPAENPQYIVLTVINLPEAYRDGEQSTAPMTKALIEKIIKYKNLAPTETTEATSTLSQNKTVTLPDYVGSVTYNVVLDLDSKALNYKMVGTGNTITNQVPKAGTTVDEGSEIILYVERSEEDMGTVAVPNVVGSTYDEALSTLSNLGFEVLFSGSTDGVVISQSPKYGVSVEKGSQVQIDLSKPETPTTPETNTE